MKSCGCCGGVASPEAMMLLSVKVTSWVSRVWGGPGSGTLPLCEECMWKLERAAGDAVAAEVHQLRVENSLVKVQSGP